MFLYVSAPASVGSLEVTNSGSNLESEVLVSWRKTDRGDDIDLYCVGWDRYAHGRIRISRKNCIEYTSGKIAYNYTITNLHFGTLYDVRVFATNSGGYGPSQLSTITTGTWCLLFNEAL